MIVPWGLYNIWAPFNSSPGIGVSIGPVYVRPASCWTAFDIQ